MTKWTNKWSPKAVSTCERGADFQHDSCSRASVVLILDMEASQGLLQGRYRGALRTRVLGGSRVGVV